VKRKTHHYIITGLSGAGKTQALKILEDWGFFCVDNLPLSVIPEFSRWISSRRIRKVAIGLDIRGLYTYSSFLDFQKIREKYLRDYQIIFFEAARLALLNRYKMSRHRHPLADTSLLRAITREKKYLRKIRHLAREIVDTSYLTIADLKEVLARCLKIVPGKNFSVTVQSFGYRYGLPLDADVVLDVRFLPNPNYRENLRQKNGLNLRVKNYVLKNNQTKKFLKVLKTFWSRLLPAYIREGKSLINIAIGCTGGRHRSVVVADWLGRFFRQQGYNSRVYHRDIDK